MVKPVLLFAYGNIARGDDALGPLLLEQLQLALTEVCGHPLKLLNDYQMQIEHVMDLQDCERVLLLDADSSLDRPFRFYPVQQKLETHYTTHGMTPSTLLHTYQQVFHQAAPETSMLALQGSRFELGEKLSEQAQRNLETALQFLSPILSSTDFSLWDRMLDNGGGYN